MGLVRHVRNLRPKVQQWLFGYRWADVLPLAYQVRRLFRPFANKHHFVLADLRCDVDEFARHCLFAKPF